MCVVDDKIEKEKESLYEINHKIEYLNHILFSNMYDGSAIKEIDAMSHEQKENELKNLYDKKENLEYNIKDEERRREIVKEENTRRQHNYMPLIFEMLKHLSESGNLESVYEKACKEEEEEAKKKTGKK